MTTASSPLVITADPIGADAPSAPPQGGGGSVRGAPADRRGTLLPPRRIRRRRHPRTEARLTPHPAPVDAERDGGQLPPAGVIA